MQICPTAEIEEVANVPLEQKEDLSKVSEESFLEAGEGESDDNDQIEDEDVDVEA